MENGKRKYGFMAAVFVVACSMLMGCQQKETDTPEKIVFEENYHQSSERYLANFETMCCEGKGFSLEIAGSIFEEKEGQKIFEKLEGDFEKLQSKEDAPQLKIYVVEAMIEGVPQIEENEIYVTQENISDGEYKRCLVQTYYDTTSLWQSIGLAGYLLEEGEDNTENLKQYYGDTAHMGMLTFFPSYFVSEFADEETIEMAENTAISVTEFLVKKYGMDEFLQNGEKASYKEEWLQSIGGKETYPWTDEDFANMGEMTSHSSVNNPLVVTVENWNFYLEKTDWLETPEDALWFVKDSIDGYAVLKEEMKEEGVLEASQVAEAFEQSKNVYLKSANGSYTYADKGDIYISHGYDIWHEMVHALAAPGEKNLFWFGEGVAEYFSRPIQAESAYVGQDWRETSYRYLTEQEDWETEETLEFKQHVIDAYMEAASFPQKEEELDLMLFYESVVKTKLAYEDLLSGAPFIDTPSGKYAGMDTDELDKASNGNAMTYVESYAFVTYLAEQYGEKKVVQALVGELSFEEAFGADYAEEYVKWNERKDA